MWHLILGPPLDVEAESKYPIELFHQTGEA
jgi:hypothetical protein